MIERKCPLTEPHAPHKYYGTWWFEGNPMKEECKCPGLLQKTSNQIPTGFIINPSEWCEGAWVQKPPIGENDPCYLCGRSVVEHLKLSPNQKRDLLGLPKYTDETIPPGPKDSTVTDNKIDEDKNHDFQYESGRQRATLLERPKYLGGSQEDWEAYSTGYTDQLLKDANKGGYVGIKARKLLKEIGHSFGDLSNGPDFDAVKIPSHYNQGQIEVANFIADQQLDYNHGNVIKYVTRAGKKNPEKELEDLEKAAAYLQMVYNVAQGLPAVVRDPETKEVVWSLFRNEKVEEASFEEQVREEHRRLIEKEQAGSSFEEQVAAERKRQIEKGYTAEHDTEHGLEHLERLAAKYALNGDAVKGVAMQQAIADLKFRQATARAFNQDTIRGV